MLISPTLTNVDVYSRRLKNLSANDPSKIEKILIVRENILKSYYVKMVYALCGYAQWGLYQNKAI